jgi:hypothetical protein
MADTNKIEGPLPWFKEDTHLYHSEEVEEIWALPGRNQHKILLLLSIIKCYITFTLKGKEPEINDQFVLSWNKLVTLSHLNRSTIESFMKELEVFGIKMLQSCNNFVTITYDNYVKLQASGKQIREDKIKLNKIKLNNTLSTSVTNKGDNFSSSEDIDSPSENLSENKKEKFVRLKKSDLNEGQLSVLLDMNEEGQFRWLRSKDFDIVSDLKRYYPDLKEEIIRKEVNNLASKFNPEKFREGAFGYLYIINCINKSYYRN